MRKLDLAYAKTKAQISCAATQTGQLLDGAKMGEPREKISGTPATELCLSHMCPVWGSNPYQTQC